MANKKKYAKAGKKDKSELDPQLWQDLSQELLERVFAKLPPSGLAAFRRVSKDWYTDIIPRVAPHVEASSESALLYFSRYKFRDFDQEFLGSAWWLKVCDSKSNLIGVVKEFQPRSFPVPQSGEDVILVDSQGGLLFFAFVSRKDLMVREIVVSNPLTSNSRPLGLPHPLKFCTRFRSYFLLGVVLDTKTGHYKLVVGGVDRSQVHETFLYDLCSSTWTNGSSLLSTILTFGLDPDFWFNFESRQCVCHKGNLYWNVTVQGFYRRQIIIKYDILEGSWRIIPLDLDPRPCVDTCPSNVMQMISFEGELLFGHLHLGPTPQNDENRAISVEELFDPNYVWYPQRTAWPCRSSLQQELDPELKMMHHYMMERLDGFLAVQADLGLHCIDYSVFSHQHIIYHVLLLQLPKTRKRSKRYLKVIVHNTIKNSYVELRPVRQYRCPSRNFLSPSDLWSFSPSLTALP